MPSFQGKPGKRKGPTPIAYRHPGDVWGRTFKLTGLEPMSSNSAALTPTPTPTPAPAIMATSNTSIPGPGSVPASAKKSILDLPSETQKDIFKHASTADLLALSLVSKHFRDIAAGQLYRSFHIVFPDQDDPLSNSPIDSLAGGLDTFVTSDYNYARYLREIILEPLSGGEKGERAYANFLYDTSCGKFMNTMLLMALRKATALETFKWDIRVELSREVFKTLHGIKALQHVHLRMQAGRSIHHASSPAASHSNTPPLVATSNPTPAPPPHSVAVGLPLFAQLHAGSFSNQLGAGSILASKSPKTDINVSLSRTRKVQPTFSGFKNLKTLEILDMDTLEYISEIRECVNNSSATMNTLKLSFSEALACKSRKPIPETPSDSDSDQDDGFPSMPPPPIFPSMMPPPGPPPPSGLAPLGTTDINTPSKPLKAQEEKKRQEAVLGRIFGLESVKAKHMPSQHVEPEKKPTEDFKNLIESLAPLASLMNLLMAAVNDGCRSEIAGPGKEIIDKITKAAKSYLDASKESKVPGAKSSPVEIPKTNTTKATSSSSTTDANDGSQLSVPMSDAVKPGLFDEPETKTKKANPDIANPDDIDVEAPEEQELVDESGPQQDTAEILGQDADASIVDGSTNQTLDTINSSTNVRDQEHKVTAGTSYMYDALLKEKVDMIKQIEELNAQSASGEIHESNYQKLGSRLNARVEWITSHLEELGRLKKVKAGTDELANEEAQMSEYIRNTRGLTLQRLAIYLIPVKASVLYRAIDLTVLQEITLLNVGPQTPFWNVLEKENRVSPLPLRKIHTDNVTLPFLTLVNHLECVEELLLLERKSNPRVESTTAKTTVTMDQIRHQALKKHASTLKVLMIRNDASLAWDLNIKSAMLLCRHAKQLEELAVSFGTRTMHTLLQFITGLTNLRALHTIQFRHEDPCMWVMREFRKFAVDSISHSPEMKLEYLALDLTVERLVRRPPTKEAGKKAKGKEKDGGLSTSVGTANGEATEGSDSDEDEEVGGKTGLKVETIDGIRFSDIDGVRIFEKDVLGGRL